MPPSSDAFAADATIGIYTEPTGSICSLAGSNPGPLTVYVFVKPGSVGVRGARFSAPIPACFDATFVSESTPEGIFSIGDSQTGISVSSGYCETDPFQVLQITYLGGGATTPCCEYLLAPDPFTGILEASGCAFESIAITSSASRFNADESCACGSMPPVHLPPDPPFNPLPADEATYVSLETELRWTCTDPAGLGITCDVYFGLDPNPPLVAQNVPSGGPTIYPLSRLNEQTAYFWRVVARNSEQRETSGPVWRFTTGANQAPGIYLASPSPRTTTLPVTPTMAWNAIDPEGDPMTFDVYLGPDPNPPLAASGVTQKSYTPPVPLAFSTQYWWHVTATDSQQHSATSETWSFITRAENEPPAQPNKPSPAGGATNVVTTPTLTWSAADPEGQPLTYDVYFGLTPATPTGAATIGLYADSYGSTCSFSGHATGLVTAYVVVRPGSRSVRQIEFAVPMPACFNATYLWEEVSYAFDATGSSQTGISLIVPWCETDAFVAMEISYLGSGSEPCCAFTLGAHPDLGHVVVKDCSFVEAPSSVVASRLNPDSTCVCDGVIDLPRVAHNIATASYSPGTLPLETDYRWRVVARDPSGLETSGPAWWFRTVPNLAPAVPSNPSPAHLATEQSEFSTLSWQCSDPEGDAITYDVAFGTAQYPSVIARNLTTPTYNPGPLALNTTYRWIITARDALGHTTTAPRWAFKTRTVIVNRPPNAPTIVSPNNGATNQALTTVVKWNATDPEGDALNFDVYFGTDASPPLVADHVTAKTYDPGALQLATTYRWKIVARDAPGHETAGPVWSFTTTNTTSLPPFAPSNPSPPDGGTAGAHPLLSWQGGDPDGDPVQYTVWLLSGDPFWGDLVGTWTTTDTHLQVPQELSPGLGYSWMVGAYDGHWNAYSPMWSFTVNHIPVAVAFRSFTAEQNGLAVDVEWELASDEPMESYTLYRRAKDGEPVALVSGGMERTRDSYRDDAVEAGRTYSYELAVRSPGGDEFRSQVATVSMERVDLTLHQNVPNPFNPQTAIRYDLPAAAHVRLMVFDVNGRLVRLLSDEDRDAGSYEEVWTGRDDAGQPVSSGVYFYVLQAGKERLTRKLVLLK